LCRNGNCDADVAAGGEIERLGWVGLRWMDGWVGGLFFGVRGGVGIVEREEVGMAVGLGWIRWAGIVCSCY
jgi:hypothetical protein